jgi:hypothetical protein
MLHLLRVHVASADGSDETFAVALSDREIQKHVPTSVGLPDGPESLLGEGVLDIHGDGMGS